MARGRSIIVILDDSPHRGRDENSFEVELSQRSGKNMNLPAPRVLSIYEDHRLPRKLAESAVAAYTCLPEVLVSQLHTESMGDFFEMLQEGCFIHVSTCPAFRPVGKTA